jgi:hypothetical protein
LENVSQVKVDLSAKTATVTMKKGILTRDVVAAALKGSRYTVSSFKSVVRFSKSYTINISGMT